MPLLDRNRIKHFLISLVYTVALCSIPAHAADDGEDTIRASANEVRIAFAASDQTGHIIKSLRSSDVAVADNGSIIRHFRSFRPAAESPLDLVLLIDASGSMESQLSREIASVKNFVKDSPWEARDRVSILVFGGLRTQMLCARDCKSQSAEEKLDSLQANGLTPLYDALFEAAAILERNRDPESRPAMILFSDGLDTISIHGRRDVIEAAQNLQSAIYCVTPPNSGAGRGEQMLQYLAATTGGLSFAPGQDVARVLGTVLEDLHSGYVLTYELPDQKGGQHGVRVLATSNPKLQFRSRQAYGATE